MITYKVTHISNDLSNKLIDNIENECTIGAVAGQPAVAKRVEGS